MSFLPHDINDDEIRIICSEKSAPENEMYDGMPPRKPRWWIIAAAVLALGVAALVWLSVGDRGDRGDADDAEELHVTVESSESVVAAGEVAPAVEELESQQKGYVEVKDTVIDRMPLTILTPMHSTPKLSVGVDALRDTTAVLVVQAADIRRDNGKIVGAYVLEGNLLSRGQSKAGFCAIINGKMVIGVADSTPYLEQAIEGGGYFFRQYPLVVGSQVVGNKLKYSSLRKALAELNGKIVVILGKKKQTLNEFSQTLVDLGVANAIYLIGSSAPGFAIEADGTKIAFGNDRQIASNSNYIVWQ